MRRPPSFLRFVLQLAFLALPALGGVLPGDEAFGLVGTGGKAFAARFGLKYYTLEGNYSPGSGTTFSSVHSANDPEAGFSVVREVAKLNVRTDALGETNAQFQTKLNNYAKALATWYPVPSCCRGSKPTLSWYQPNASALAAAESLQIVETIRREKARNPAVTGTVWEIGNEPNLFPAILPTEYAALFEAYRRIIKAEDPTALVAMGSLFIPEVNQDLKAKLGEELETKMQAELQAAGVYTAVHAAGFFDDLVNDVKNTMLSRMMALSTREYLRQVLLATSARPDLVTLHVYPFDDRAPALDSAARRAVLDTTFAGVRAQLLSQGSTARVWITEFGNIEQGKDEQAVAKLSQDLIAAFRAQDSVEKWFHYKSTGADEQFALFSTGTPPLTRLANDPAFTPATGAFACSRLNAVGRAYYRESHGGASCAERVSFALPSSSRAENGATAITAILDAPSDDPVTVHWAVRAGSAEASDYNNATGTLSFAAGETSKNLDFAVVDDVLKESDESAVIRLHSPSGLALTADSQHVATIFDNENAAPKVDSVRPLEPRVAEGDSILLKGYARDAEGDAFTYTWLRQNGDTIGVGQEITFRPGYADAGTEALRLDLRDAQGSRSTRHVEVVIANVPLKPAIANAPGSTLSPGATISWNWPGNRPDPDFDAATQVASFEFRIDSASAQPSGRFDGVRGGNVVVTMDGAAGPVWARVRLLDGSNKESPWSDPVRLAWTGSATRLAHPNARLLPTTLTLEARASAGGAPSLLIGLPAAAAVEIDFLSVSGATALAPWRGDLPAGWHVLILPVAPSQGGPGAGIRVARLKAGGGMRTTVLAF